MNRKLFEKEDFISAVNEYGSKGIHIHSYNIIGFPGETEEDFQEMLDYMESIETENFSNLNFMYSDRPGTAAAKYPDKVPYEIITERTKRINELYASHSQKRCSVFPEDVREAILKLHNLQTEYTSLTERYSDHISQKLNKN